MKVLVACEESQRVCSAFRARGHEAYSCDIIDPSGGHPEWHIKTDVLNILNPNETFHQIVFYTQDSTVHFIDRWDLIIAHPPCFVAGTKVMTYEGIKNIEDVQIGDRVLTHTGAFKHVTDTMVHYASELVDVQIENSGHIYCTPNHRFYTQTVTKGRKRHLNGNFEWKNPTEFYTKRNSSGDIKEKTMVASITDNIYEPCKWEGIEKGLNGNSTIQVNTLPVSDPHFWYIIGRWLGDGWIYRKNENGKNQLRGIEICCNKLETEELQQKFNLAKFETRPTEERTTNKFYIYSKELAEFCLQFGEGAENKHIPGFVTRLPQELAESFLRGYFDADGCDTVPNKISYTSVRSNLAYGIKYMINKYYHRPCSITWNNNSNRTVIQGRVCNIKDSYSGTFHIEKTKQEHCIEYENYMMAPYRQVTKLTEGAMVYNLSVEDDESYTANGVIVHNCTYLTVTGNRWFNVEKYGDKAIERLKLREEAVDFFMEFANADCDHIAIENPIGIMSTRWRKPDQIVQPYWFGDPFEKRTCLWLKGLPKLKKTNEVQPEERAQYKSGKTLPAWFAAASSLPPAERSRIRSQTFPGFAAAMAEQWG